jgi:nucleoredoxin
MSALTNPMEKLLGASLVGAGGAAQPTTEALAGKEVVALYFSAHWCPPCRGFTPKLAGYYKDIVAAGKSLEIVFVSSDKDQGSFDEYFGEQPWLALPFSERDLKGALSSKYGVSGIPTLVLLDGATGALITKDGRSAITEDPTGESFPWTPPTLAEMLGDEFTAKDGKTVPFPKGKKIALYFSAHWCPPCRGFTPKLVATYNAMKEVPAIGDDVEFIFVSSDRDDASFREYFGEMPWLALPFDKRKEKEALSRHFGVSGIPSLVTLDENLNVVNKNARGPCDEDPKGENFPWAPKPCEDLTKTVDCNGFDVNEKPALVALYDGVSDAAEAAAIQAAVQKVAAAHAAKAKAAGEDPDLIFFTAASAGGPVGQVKSLCELPSTAAESPTLLLLDIPDNGGFYTKVPDSGITEDSLNQFLADYATKALDRQQLKK